jgi:hypothetical protein
MIIRKAQFAFSIFTLSLIGVFVSSAVSTLRGTEQHESASGAGQTVHLMGEWALNKDLSDDPEKVVESMHQGRGGSGRGRWMHAGGGGRSMDTGKMEAMQRAMETPAKLMISQADESITFTNGDGRSQTFATNNKKEKHTFGNDTVDVKTKWEDGRLVKETSLDDGLKLTETYSLLVNADQLRVLVNVKGHMGREVTLKRVYDRERHR